MDEQLSPEEIHAAFAAFIRAIEDYGAQSGVGIATVADDGAGMSIQMYYSPETARQLIEVDKRRDSLNSILVKTTKVQWGPDEATNAVPSSAR